MVKCESRTSSSQGQYEAGSGGSGVVGVVLTRHLLALLAECSQCRCTTVEYDLDWTMHASWDPDVALMRSSSGSSFASSRWCIAGRASAAYLYKVEYELDLTMHIS